MAIADSSETRLYFIPEVTPGTTPANPAWVRFRNTGESLAEGQNTVTSDEITDNADVSDEIVTGRNTNGDVNFELSYGSFDTVLAAALRGAWASNVLKAGVLKPSLSLEKRFETGGTDRFFRYRGSRVSAFALNFPTRDKVTGSFSFQGEQETVATAALAGATYGAANTNSIMTANDMANIALGGMSGETIHFTNFSLRMANNLRDQGELGSEASIGVGFGRRDLTGGLTAYFETEAMYNLYKNAEYVTFGFDISDGTNTYALLLPRFKFTSGRVVAGGNNQDVVAEMGWRAFYDTTEATSLRLDR